MHVAIVGGGLAGLTAANYLSRGGHEVTVFERRKHLGGRAQTTQHEGFSFNLGPHALYRGGHAEAVLTELGVPIVGGNPVAFKADRIAWNEGVGHLLPTGPLSMLKTDLMTFADKIAFTRVAGGLGATRTTEWRGRSAQMWVDSVTTRPRVQALLHALIRLSSYVDHRMDLDAEVAIEQLSASVNRGVVYLDGGWSRLAIGLRRQAKDVHFVNDCKIERVTTEGDGVQVRHSDGVVAFHRAVIAAGANVAGALLGRRFDVAPIRAACLTIALSSERPRHQSPFGPCTFAMGIDQSFYYSAHHDAAALAPPGGQLIHLLRYLSPTNHYDQAESRGMLERVMDNMQPGWRNFVVHEAFRPKLTVAWDTPLASRGGLAARTPVVTEDPRIVLAGDWIGNVGHLADAAFASGKAAAEVLATRAAKAA